MFSLKNKWSVISFNKDLIKNPRHLLVNGKECKCVDCDECPERVDKLNCEECCSCDERDCPCEYGCECREGECPCCESPSGCECPFRYPCQCECECVCDTCLCCTIDDLLVKCIVIENGVHHFISFEKDIKLHKVCEEDECKYADETHHYRHLFLTEEEFNVLRVIPENNKKNARFSSKMLDYSHRVVYNTKLVFDAYKQYQKDENSFGTSITCGCAVNEFTGCDRLYCVAVNIAGIQIRVEDYDLLEELKKSKCFERGIHYHYSPFTGVKSWWVVNKDIC